VRPRKLQRRLILASLGGMLAAATITTGVARADLNVCSALHNSPTVGTVEQLVLEFTDDGWTPGESGEIIARSVVGGCPQFVPILNQFIAKWTPAKTVRS
jgi:hypothetical protein